MSQPIASAVFDSREEAERALSELRSVGVREESISILGQSEDRGDGENRIEDTDHEAKEDVVSGAAVGTAAGALLGVAALAIPGVGPLAAAGAIAASAIPSAAVIGGGAGMAAGSVVGLLKDHGVDEEDASYYDERLRSGGYLLTVTGGDVPNETVSDILYRHGGHSARRARTAAM
jgi:hypothetical protein